MKKWLLAALIVGGAVHWWQGRPVYTGPGVIAPNHPVQASADHAAAISMGSFTLSPVASFQVEARVLSREDYRVGREAELAPVDLALGWGPMSDSAVLAGLKISQGNRFYFYSWRDQPPIPRNDIVIHSANMHLIPANDTVAAALKRVRVGQVVRFEGYLVNVTHPDGWRWNSSTRRDDSGNGACELVWVQRLVAVDPPT